MTLSRRSLLAAGALGPASCGRSSGYFGKAEAPQRQRLVYGVGGEPETLDPAKTAAGPESYIIPSLFEALIFPHPITSRPMAGLATHFESNSDHTRFTFYLKGHANPRGNRLPSTESLPSAFPRRRAAPRKDPSAPARWSDGHPITAHDFVFSWRRAVSPVTASPYAAFLYYILHAEEINGGKRPLSDLAVTAMDDYTLQVQMRSSTPFFLEVQEAPAYYAVPQHAIKAAERSGADWASPDRIVTGGPFQVKDWKPRDRMTLIRNPHYYDADLVNLDELVLLPVVDASTNLNIYKAAESHSMLGKVVAPSFIPLLRSKRDFESAPAYWTMFYSINTTRPPFDNVLVRYAMNMAIDKRAIAHFLRAGQSPAAGLLPPLTGYHQPIELPVKIGGATYDVLQYNPEAARHLLQLAGCGPLHIDVLYPMLPASRDIPLILQKQWEQTLHAKVTLRGQEETVCIQNRNSLQYSGVAERGWWADYLDPNTFLEAFLSGPSVIGAGWSDRRFDALLAEANAISSPAGRMRKLAGCERLLLTAMPVLPLYYNVQAVLKKPFVRGMAAAKVDSVRFKYAWIDTEWSNA